MRNMFLNVQNENSSENLFVINAFAILFQAFKKDLTDNSIVSVPGDQTNKDAVD